MASNTIVKKPSTVSAAATPAARTAAADVHLVIKRCIDILLSATAFICCLPLLLLCMVAIVIENPGSPIYLQKRIGRNGRVFQIFKLRSMRIGAENHGFRTVANDHRLTVVGRILRHTNIDELPQLLNIIKGDMSIIGPRPLSVTETHYLRNNVGIKSDYPGFFPTVRPGLVGLEQINRDRELTYLERFDFNDEYERNMSIQTDWNIFVRAALMCKDVCLVTAAGGIGLILVATIVPLLQAR